MRKNSIAAPARFLRPWLTVMLAVVLTFSSFAGLAYADEVVTGISFDNAPSPATLNIGDDDLQLEVNASIQGSSSLKDVTTDVTWTTSNSSVVKVAAGLLTGIAKGSATITASYKGYKITLPVSVTYMYDSVTIKDNGTSVSDTLKVNLGDELDFDLIASKSGAADTNVTEEAVWTSSNTNVATIDDGEVTLVAVGDTTITAKYKGRTDSVKLSASSPYKSLTIAPNTLMEFKVGDPSRTLKASAEDTAGDIDDVSTNASWISADAKVATVDKGVVTPVGTGTTTITASYLGVSGSVTVVVRPAFEAMRITPKEDLHLMINGSDVALKVEVMNGINTPDDVTALATWTSSNVYAATVSDSGVVSPKGIGSTVIKATYKGTSQQVNVTVYPTISGTLTAAKDTLDAFPDDKITLPKVTAQSISDETIDVSDLAVWESSDKEILDKVDGKWTAKKIGKAVLTATILSKTVTITVNVHEKPLLLTADQTNLSIVIGKETKLPVLTMTYESGSEEDVTSLVTWKSSSSNLIVKAPNIRGLQASTATLTATYLGKSTTVRVTIEEEITKLTAESTTLTISPLRSYTLKVTGTYKSGKTIALGTKMNWEINPDSLASIKGSSLKALKEGTGTLTGTYQGKTITFTVNVVAKVKKLTSASKSLTLAPEAKVAVTVTAEYEGGRVTDVTKAADWTTGNSKVATVVDGVITGVAKGSTVIRAKLEGKTVSIRVSVK
ncbi:Ig-like domain-containing protein [Paenibacillus sp. R14(2021)]|uniref:Ig-like domain-containing protein n=1 Tax=Paenibacillus sp. R14(2021) TaxID=2859228 RepID=UPI001C6116D3|nr:Ig-like domain-containing protein [Paenibacillus sp. R14(2021)]